VSWAVGYIRYVSFFAWKNIFCAILLHYVTGGIILLSTTNYKLAYSVDTDKESYKNNAVHIIGLLEGDPKIE
jgi:hypothetical protein